MAYVRAQISTLLDRLDEAPERLILITGPRQTGKTTLVRHALERLERPFLYLPVDEPESPGLPSFPGWSESTFAIPSDPLSSPGTRSRRRGPTEASGVAWSRVPSAPICSIPAPPRSACITGGIEAARWTSS